MFKSIDRSPALSRLIEATSTTLARKRGLPIVIGIGFVVVSFVLQLIDVFTLVIWFDLFGVITLYLGLLAALIGLVLSEPLGK